MSELLRLFCSNGPRQQLAHTKVKRVVACRSRALNFKPTFLVEKLVRIIVEIILFIGIAA